MKKKIFFWSPMLSHIGTHQAVVSMAESLSEHGDFKVYLINVFGEFDDYNNSTIEKINLLNVKNYIPSKGKISKIIYYVLTFLLIPVMFNLVKKKKPDIIISNLVGYIPNFIKIFLNIKVINSIQGLPRFNLFRKIIWKMFYSNSNHILTMTNLTKEMIVRELNISKDKITKVDNPIISRNIIKLSNEEIESELKPIFQKDVFCSIGRLTRQKNYFELLSGFDTFIKKTKKQINLVIIGDGEFKNSLIKYIKEKNIPNCYLIGFKQNPFKYLKKSKLFISTSLWEDPGHTLIEAGYLNVPVLSSCCPNGPKEIIKDDITGFCYELNNIGNLAEKMEKITNYKNKDIYKIKLNFKKKIIKNFTKYYFVKSITKILST